MSNIARALSKIVREQGKDLFLIASPGEASFLINVYGHPDRAKNASPQQTRQAERILNQYNLI